MIANHIQSNFNLQEQAAYFIDLAVQRLFPESKPRSMKFDADSFIYEIDYEQPLLKDDLKSIEREARRLLENLSGKNGPISKIKINACILPQKYYQWRYWCIQSIQGIAE